jgi:hypothetical protein
LSLLMAATAALCLAQFPPPSDSGQYAAKVLTITGQVSVLKDTVLYALTDGGSVQVQQMIVTGPDGHATFQVSDGSTFEVFPNSHLVFRKNAWNVKDMIDLLVGRIRVHIEHLGSTPNPNRILTPTAVISVRGTTFEITVNEDDETTMVEVEDGLVEVRHALLPSDRPKMLGPGDSIKVYKSQPLDASVLDRGTILHYAFNAIRDMANLMAMRANGGISGGGTSPGNPDVGKKPAPPPPPPPPPAPGHFVDNGSADAGSVDAAVPVEKHRSFRSVIRATAKQSVKWLGRLTGITSPVFNPMASHRIY